MIDDELRAHIERLMERRNRMAEECTLLLATAAELEKEIYVIDGQIMEAADAVPQ